MLVLLFFGLASCKVVPLDSGNIDVSIQDGSNQQKITVSSGLSVSQILDTAKLSLGNLDRTEPPSYTIITSSETIRIVRVNEEFRIKDVDIPYVQQNIKNESLLEGQTHLIQSGRNGIKQVTYRRLFENGTLVSESIFSQAVITDQVPEIIMVGVSQPFVPLEIPGELAYIIAGNAWMMKNDTSLRTPIVSTGDLDGHVFSISYDGKWLLYTRKISTKPEGINSLWVVNLEKSDQTPIDLGVSNIVSHAAWVPGESNTITYSTAQPVASAPGWQANNDLFILSFSEGGSIWRNERVVDTNGGGLYGWWGSSFFWSPNGSTLAYARPDGIGYVDFKNHMLVQTIAITPYSSQSSWAWVPFLGWSPDSKALFFASPAETISPQSVTSQFNLVVASEADFSTISIAENIGMFSNPVPSPITEYGHFMVAAFKAVDPAQSTSSKVRLIVLDRDGSNSREVFPPSGLPGMNPGRICWAPDHPAGQPYYLAVVYLGNLWLITSEDGSSHQITSDGLIDTIDWK